VDFNRFAAQHLVVVPAHAGNGLVGVFALAVVHQPVAFERAVKYFACPVDVQHDLLGGVPGVHQHAVERQLFVFEGIVEHVPHVVELGLAVRVGVVDAPIDDPVLAGVEVDIQAVDDADALDDAVFVAAILTADEFYVERVALVQHRVVEYQAGVLGVADGVLHRQPHGFGRYIVLHEIPVYGIMRKKRMMLGHVGLRIID